MMENQIHLTPSSFFGLEIECHRLQKPSPRQLSEKHQLPDVSDLCRENTFADVFLGWCPQGIAAKIVVNQPIERSSYPEFSLGDGVELFIDTRDLKSAGFNTRFCHHFVFLAEKIEGFQALEVTRFRTEDTHPLCEPTALDLTISSSKNTYTLFIFIPQHCLVGYDPEQFDRLGFAYRINRWGKSSQHFGVTSQEFAIDQYPSLWPSLKLIKR